MFVNFVNNTQGLTLIKKITNINQYISDPANPCLTDINRYYLILYTFILSHPEPIICQYYS